jgi:hypothetical protein
VDNNGDKKRVRQLKQIDSGLEDALGLSGDVLEALQEVSSMAEKWRDRETLKELSATLEKCSSEVSSLLGRLREGVSQAHVACENANAVMVSDADLERLTDFLNGRTGNSDSEQTFSEVTGTSQAETSGN